MYSNVVLNEFNNPKNTGRISKPDGIASCFNFDNTAHVEFSLRIESGIITNCQFRAQADPYIIAVCSVITKMLKGKMVAMVFLDPYSIMQELGAEYDEDITFCINCVKMAIDDYKEKLGTVVKETKKQSKKKAKGIEEEKEVSEAVEEETIETAQEEKVFEETTAEAEAIEETKTETENDEERPEDFDDDFDFSDFFDDEGI